MSQCPVLLQPWLNRGYHNNPEGVETICASHRIAWKSVAALDETRLALLGSIEIVDPLHVDSSLRGRPMFADPNESHGSVATRDATTLGLICPSCVPPRVEATQGSGSTTSWLKTAALRCPSKVLKTRSRPIFRNAVPYFRIYTSSSF
jgi:hypothetical protein